MFPILTRLVRQRLVLTFFVLFFLQLIGLLYIRNTISQHRQAQKVSANLHASVAAVLSENVTAQDFASMGNKVAALGELAEHYVQNRALNHSHLTEAIAQHFPWWNENLLSYVPWRRQKWYQSWPKQTRWSSTGIVICVGERNIQEALFLITNLRTVLRSKLPIEIAYAGDSDLSLRNRNFLSEIDAKIQFIDLTKVFDDSLIELSGWATKPYALLASQYPRTILVDADAVFFSRPDLAWDQHRGLQDTGTLFFHDRSITNQGSHERRVFVAQQLGLSGRQQSAHLNDSSLFYRGYIGEEADSAVVYFDKSRPKLYTAALFAAWMNSREVRDAITWNLFWGDKETYWLATELSGVPYTFEHWQAARFAEVGRTVDRAIHPGADDDSPGARTCSRHMVHSNINGDEPFWANGGIWQDKEDKSQGFGNWTHWFLGLRIDQVLGAFGSDSTFEYTDMQIGGGDDSNTIALPAPANELQVMATQPVWINNNWDEDAQGCPQHEERHWRELTPDFRRRLNAITYEATKIMERYRQETQT